MLKSTVFSFFTYYESTMIRKQAIYCSAAGLLTTLAFQLGPDRPAQYALEGSVAVAGLGISWLRDNLGVLASAKDSEALAASVDSTAGVYFVPAFSGAHGTSCLGSSRVLCGSGLRLVGAVVALPLLLDRRKGLRLQACWCPTGRTARVEPCLDTTEAILKISTSRSTTPPPPAGLLAPHWQDSARGALLGLSGYSTKAHVVRAMLEAVCWQSREVLDAMRADADLKGALVV